MKLSRYISFLVAVLMLFSAACLPFSASAAVDLSEFNLTTGQKYFLRVLGSLSRADYYQTDVLGSVTLAQAIYEGGWGRYSLPVGGNNLFGIKAYSSWPGMVYDQKTSILYSCYSDYLFAEGQGHINTYSAWRAHENWAESVAVHSALFHNESKYAAVVGEKDYKVAAKAIVDAGYCDDYGYVDTVIKLIEQYGLTEYDDLTPDEDGVVAVVTEPERVLLDIGSEYTVPLTYYPETAVASSVTWASDNESVATVDENGKVTALAHGMTLITATLANGREACCIVYVDCNATVIDKDATVYTSPSTSADNNGKIYRGIAAKVLDETVYTDTDGTGFYKVEGYNSKNELVNGYLLAQYIYLNKRNVSTIAVVKDDITVKLGESYTVKTAVAPADAVDTTLIWTSDNESVATVDENGVITANAIGSAVITASAFGGCERKISVTVAEEYREYKALVSAYETLTVRTEPKSDSARAGKLDFLSSVTVIGEAEGEWYKISGTEADGDSVVGYANSAYIRIIEDSHTVTYGNAPADIKVYSEKNTNSISYGTLTEESVYAILELDDENGWSYIVGIKTSDEAVHGYAQLDGSGSTVTPPDIEQGSDIPANSYYGRTTSDLYVRSGAGSGYEAVGQFANGTQIIIVGDAVDGWYSVMGIDKDGNEISGYSSADYITVLYSGSVNATTLNVRDAAVSGEVVGQFKKDEKIIVVGDIIDGWYSVESLDGSIKGYCSGDYIVLNGRLEPPKEEDPEQSFEILDNSLSITEGVLTGVKLETSAEALLACFNGDVRLTDAEGNLLEGEALVGTGCKLILSTDSEEKTLAEILVKGDVDGNGKVSEMDYILIKRHFFGTYTLQGLYYEAALLSGENYVDVLDYVLVKRHYFGTYVIS